MINPKPWSFLDNDSIEFNESEMEKFQKYVKKYSTNQKLATFTRYGCNLIYTDQPHKNQNQDIKLSWKMTNIWSGKLLRWNIWICISSYYET